MALQNPFVPLLLDSRVAVVCFGAAVQPWSHQGRCRVQPFLGRGQGLLVCPLDCLQERSLELRFLKSTGMTNCFGFPALIVKQCE